MAHLIAPPSSVQPMTKEDVAVVQAEKRVDAATREQLVKVYGDSRDPHGRPIDLTRPSHRNWKCAACGKTSTDIRHVCGFCLAPEPGYTNPQLHRNNTTNVSNSSHAHANGKRPPAAVAGKVISHATTAAEVASDSTVHRPGSSSDSGVQLIQLHTTKRCYRVYAEPHVPTAASHAKSVQRAALAGALTDDMGFEDGAEDDEEGEDPVWDDEPDCRPGATRRPHGSAAGNKDGSQGEENSAAATTEATQRRAPNEEKVDGGFTHFISIPLGKLPAITANATRVLEDVRSFVGAQAHVDGERDQDDEDGGEASAAAAAASASPVSKSAATPDLVTSTARLHMTLLMLTLPTREDVEFAKELLQGPFASAWAALKEKFVVASKHGNTTDPLALSGDTSLAPAHRHPLLHLGGGLQVMKSGANNELYHPEKASVVYMGIDDAAALSTVQQLQRVLHSSFAELIHDFAEAERSKRVLHVTILNKKWRKARGARRPFDARPIIEVFQEASIGAGDNGEQPFEIPELELCSMRRHDEETGTYFAEATVKI